MDLHHTIRHQRGCFCSGFGYWVRAMRLIPPPGIQKRSLLSPQSVSALLVFVDVPYLAFDFPDPDDSPHVQVYVHDSHDNIVNGSMNGLSNWDGVPSSLKVPASSVVAEPRHFGFTAGLERPRTKSNAHVLRTQDLWRMVVLRTTKVVDGQRFL